MSQSLRATLRADLRRIENNKLILYRIKHRIPNMPIGLSEEDYRPRPQREEDPPQVDDSNTVLIDAPEAARILGISVDALYMRVSRCQVSGVVKTGRQTQFHRERLLSSLERKARK